LPIKLLTLVVRVEGSRALEHVLSEGLPFRQLVFLGVSMAPCVLVAALCGPMLWSEEEALNTFEKSGSIGIDDVFP